MRLDGGDVFKHNGAFSFQIATDEQVETDPYGTRSSATAARRARAAGAKINGACHGRSPRAS